MTATHCGYFDESGDLEEAPGVFCISGYFLTSDASNAMDHKWRAVLSEHGIPAFHMVDCAHGTGAFENKSKDERIDIEKKCIELIKAHTLQGFSVIAHADTFKPPESEDDDVYSHCAGMAVSALWMFLQTSRITGDIACFFESGHQSAGRAYNRLATRLREFSASVDFGDKAQVLLLQAADLLAWQTTKYVKDGLSSARKPRKDFLSLMEHPHSFAYITLKDGHKYMGVEMWPLSQRSQATANLSIDRSGPIVLLREHGENIPIIPISRSLGWRMGGGRMALVALKDMAQTDLYLGLDEPRLIEALVTLAGATSLYTTDGTPLKIPVTGIESERSGDESTLRVTLANGPILVFRVSTDVLAKFRGAIVT